jgi:hypothetical protein
MHGKTNEQIRSERKSLVQELEEEGYGIIDSIIADTPEKAFNEPVFYLSQSIYLLSLSDLVYFMDGWENARGCKIEHTIVKEYGIPILRD